MRVFITGITGTLGTALALLHRERGDDVLGCARNEGKVVEWLDRRPRVATVLVGCASRLGQYDSDVGRLLKTVDRVYHCSAMKHVDVCEQMPAEAFYQNVCITGAVVTACERARVPLVFASTDKACLPTGAYGASKLMAEKVVVRHGGTAVRFGNLIGSFGSVFDRWNADAPSGRPVKVTDRLMTRFFMAVWEAAVFMAKAGDDGNAGVRVPAGFIRAAEMGRVADAYARAKGLPGVEVIGLRPGETAHQWMCAPGEFPEYPDGLSSMAAERWDVDRLLAEAGVKIT